MKKIFLENNVQSVHFIGIGGISMSGLAEMLHKSGYGVSGSDWKSSPTTEHLSSIGIPVSIGHFAENIRDGFSLVVYTAAVAADNPEIIAARQKNIPVIDRAHLVNQIMKNYLYSICVSGMHGKTTTTSMLAEIFISAQADPTISLGGFYEPMKSNFRTGDSEYFILEACEYCDSFLQFFPRIGVILNVEEEHLDYFAGIEHIENSFHQFASNIDSDGTLVIHGGIKSLQKLTKDLPCRTITYGTPDSQIHAEDLSFDKYALPTFTIYDVDKIVGDVTLQVVGQHNVDNALAAFTAARAAGLPPEQILEGLRRFKGSHRRNERLGNINGIEIIDDYSHHPTEIKAALAAARHLPNNRIWCLFQPHTYSRTKTLFQQFTEAFDEADEIVILDIYSAREADPGDVHSRHLADALVKRGKSAHYIESFEAAEKFLFKNCFPNDLLITMGAGDVNLVAENMLRTDLSTLSTDF